MSPIFLDQACKTSPLQRRQCQKKNQNHQGVPQPCLERDPQNVRHKICSKVKVQRPHHWPPDLNFYLYIKCLKVQIWQNDILCWVGRTKGATKRQIQSAQDLNFWVKIWQIFAKICGNYEESILKNYNKIFILREAII